MDHINLHEIGQESLHGGNAALSSIFDADIVNIASPIIFGLDEHIRHEIEAVREFKIFDHENPAYRPKDRLVVLLTTPGGYIEVVERMVAVFRRHYETIEYVIPNHAFSAGTVLALSGDKIWMDYFSVLGPIDPQFVFENGERRAGMGYLREYENLIQKINEADSPSDVTAEMTFLIEKFDPAKLFAIEQAIEHSKSLLIDWLPKHKFKDWSKTRGRGLEVGEDMKKARAENIAQILGDASYWHSHGRGISMSELESDEIGLIIDDFGSENDRNINIRQYYGLFDDFMVQTGWQASTHTIVRSRRVTL